MKIAVLGALGQLGRDLAPRLKGEVLPLGRADADLTNADALRRRLTELRPDTVINCAAYNFVDKAETEPEPAFAVNAWGVRDLAMICRDFDILLVHFSTDYVFGLDSQRQTPWREEEAPGPVSVYGLSKLSGEYLVRAICPRHLVIRTCGLYGVWGTGGKGGNFVETMLRFAAQAKPLRVVDDQRCTPSYTADVAEYAGHLIEANATGLFHLTNDGDCTWYEFARMIFELAGVKAHLTPIPSTERRDPARRPGYSVLSVEKLTATVSIRPRSWREAIAIYLAERNRR